MIDLDEIRKEVAIKNGILLDKADPQLTMVTINQMLLDKAVATLHAQNIEHQKKTVEAVVSVMAESLAKEKETAGRVITDGTDYVAKTCRKEIEAAFAKGLKEMAKSQDAAKHDGIRNAFVYTLGVISFLGIVLFLLVKIV
ncbi:MAG TPA: hypothetical protein VFS89_03745 [Nitrosospira sp.]|nr:hypothetical protein [Nitrosospira sp.]